jgi:hypothetical protein
MAMRLSALRASRPLPPGRFLGLISVRGWVVLRSILRLEVLGQLRSPVTSSGIEPTTSRLVVVPQLTTLPRTQSFSIYLRLYYCHCWVAVLWLARGNSQRLLPLCCNQFRLGCRVAWMLLALSWLLYSLYDGKMFKLLSMSWYALLAGATSTYF